MKLRNTYYILRHGEALSNVKQVCSSWPETFLNPLTARGIEMIQEAAKSLKDKNIDMMFASDLLRTKQTAQIVNSVLNINLEFDKRLREIDFGVLNGGPIINLDKSFKDESQRINQAMPEGETYIGVSNRAYDFLKDIDARYDNKTILIVSHESVLWMLECKVRGISLKEGLKKISREERIHKGEIKKLN